MNKSFDKQFEAVSKAIGEAVENNKDVGTVIENLFNNEMADKLKHSLASAFLKGLTVGATHGADTLGKKDYKGISDEVKRLFNLWIDEHGLELCKTINDTTKKELRKALSEAITEGLSTAQQKKLLIETAGDVFTKGKEWRAELIARTESCSTVNAGTDLLYQSEGVQYKSWLAVKDNRTRDQHLIIDGAVVAMGDKFELPNGDLMEYPADPYGSAENVCNCRCSIYPIVE